MKKLKFVVVLFVVLLCGCENKIASDDIVSASMISLVATPEKFVGKVVSVKGFLSLHAGGVLYVDERHSQINDAVSGIEINSAHALEGAAKRQCDESYISVVGVVKNKQGNIYELQSIQKMRSINKNRDCLLD